jgi:hypothetical protein
MFESDDDDQLHLNTLILSTHIYRPKMIVFSDWLHKIIAISVYDSFFRKTRRLLKAFAPSVKGSNRIAWGDVGS